MAHVEGLRAALEVPASELLEREAALAKLEDAFTATQQGEGRMVLVAGDAGIGKTSLVRTFCSQREDGARVVVGWCDGLRTPRPLAPFVDIGAEIGERLEQVVAAGEDARSAFAALVDELRSGDETVVVIEDVHWADDATLDVLRLLGRRIEQLGSLVVVTYRADELRRTHPLRIALGDLATAAGIVRLRLDPLSPEAVEELAAPYGIDAADLYAKTAGNPFFVTEVLASGSGEIPSTISDAVFARASRLGPAARALLDAVAIVPQRTELWLLEAIAVEALDALEECQASGILRPEGDAVAFRHELARLVVEESIDPHQRVDLHRAALQALRSPPDGQRDLARLAHHAEAAGDAESVLEFAPAAAERAVAAGAHREAAAQYARALRFGDRLPPADRAELLERRSRECYVADQHDQAIEALEEALECRRQLGQRLEEGAALSWLAHILVCPGRNAESEQTARRAVVLLQDLPPGRELAMAYASLAESCMNHSLADEAVGWGYRALGLAERLGETEIALRATVAIGVCDPNQRHRLEEALELARRADLPDHVGRALMHMAGGAVQDRRHDLPYLDPAIDYCADHGLDLHRYYLLAFRARLQLEQGRWAEATDTAEHVLRLDRTSIAPRIWALAVLGLVRARRGDPGHQPPLEEAWALAQPAGDVFRLWPPATARAEAAWLGGDLRGVIAATEGVFEQSAKLGWAWVTGELALWRRRAGVEEPIPPGIAEPYALELGGEWKPASELWRRLDCPYEAALALAVADEEEPLRQALEELQQLGARPAAAIVARRLRERGARGLPRGPRPTTQKNPANLTTREVEVLGLVAQGLQNAQIAQRLVLSKSTVDHHVAAILRKLDARTRGEASAKAVALGLASQDR
jgi:DNA-binding CsgD family transcriptional regulator/tetratricopeptide (TPR) repeat protein